MYTLLLFVLSVIGLKAQNCQPPSALATYSFNDVQVILGGGGYTTSPFGWSTAAVQATFDDGPLKSLMYASGFWIGAQTQDQGLRVAVATYPLSSGADYFPGPLQLDPLDPVLEDCGLWFDRHFVVHRALVDRHKTYHECAENPECDIEQLFPLGYVTPQALLDYPGRTPGFNIEGAPFFDADGDGFYDPAAGDLPLFIGLADEPDCCYALKGDRVLLWLANDLANVHSLSQGIPLGIELEQVVYTHFSDALTAPIFMRQRVTNRSHDNYVEVYAGHFLDPDIGHYGDDQFGCDPSRDLMFFYNSDGYDDTIVEKDGSVINGWGSTIPTIGFSILSAPFASSSANQLAVTMFTDYSFAAGLPTFSPGYYNWLRGVQMNGEVMTQPDGTYYLNTGYPTGPSLLMGHDVKGVAAMPKFDFDAGTSFCTESVLFVNANTEGLPPYTATLPLASMRDSIHAAWLTCFECVPPVVRIVAEELNGGFAFVNLSDAESYSWDFGDGNTSQAPFPQHTYATSQTVTVTLTVSNACGSAFGSFELAPAVSVAESLGALPGGWSVYPNPTSGQLTVEGLRLSEGELLRVLHPTGQVAVEERITGSRISIDLEAFAPGVYLIVQHKDNGTYRQQRIMVVR